MYYSALLFTEELPSKKEISKIMQPYCYSNAEYDKNDMRITPHPVFEWDWYQIGGRYNGELKLKVDMDDDYYKWRYCLRESEERNNRLFYSYLLSEMKEFANGSIMYGEEDFFASMGMRDGYIYVDGARVDDLLNFEELDCYICIDVDGNAIARSSWNGEDFVEDKNFDEKLAKIKKESQGMFVTVLDIHD